MKYKYLILIIIVGVLLRIVNISDKVLPMYGDELTIVYDAYSIFKTGQDQQGNVFPLTFEMGAGRPGGYVYLTSIFTAFFGPSTLAVRLPSVLSGIGIIFLIYLLSRNLFSEKTALCAAFLTAVSPWTVQLSRVGFEANFALFLVLTAIYLFIRGANKSYFYIISTFLFGIVLHTYPTYKVSLLMFIPLLIWYVGKKEILRSKTYLFLSAIVLSIFIILAVLQTFKGGSEVRFAQINVFSKTDLMSSIEQKINFERSISLLPGEVSKYFHNKSIEYGKVVLENYLQNFSIDFLVLHGDRNPRHNMATMGQLYLAETILFIIGLVSFWQKEKRKLIFLFIWLLIAPIPTSIIDLPHALRSFFMIAPLILIAALGLNTAISLKNKTMVICLGLIFFIQFLFFIQKINFLAPVEYGRFWSYSAKEASLIAIGNKSKYDYVLMSDKIDNIEFAYPVYAKVDPKEVIKQNNGSKVDLNGVNFKKFENVYIGSINENDLEGFVQSINGSVLVIASPNVKSGSYEVVNGRDNLPILSLIKK